MIVGDVVELADQTSYTLGGPPLPYAFVKLSNLSSFGLIVSIGAGQIYLPPYTEDLLTLPSTGPSVQVTTRLPAGASVPTGSPAELVPTYYTTDEQPAGSWPNPLTSQAVAAAIAGAMQAQITGGQLTTSGGTPVQPVSDQLTSGDLGTGADGAVTLTANSTLVRDMQYSSLTVNAGVTLNTGGYVIRCQGTLTNNGTIANNGGNAIAGTGGGATPGAGAPTGTLLGGAAGVAAPTGNFSNGVNALTADVEGGAGGSASGSYVGNGGTVTVSGALGLSMSGLRSLKYSGGASGGAQSGTASGGAGGVIIIFTGSTAGSGALHANGGNSALNGGQTGSAGGSGGGVVYVACRDRGDTWILQASAGAAAAQGGATGNPGFPGRTGLLICNGS